MFFISFSLVVPRVQRCGLEIKRELLNKFANYIGSGEAHLVLSGDITLSAERCKVNAICE